MPTPSVRSFTPYADTSSETDHPLDAPASMAVGDYVYLLVCLDVDSTFTSTGFSSLYGDISVGARAGAAVLRKAYDAGDGSTYTVVTVVERMAGVALAIENDGGIHAYSAAPESGIGTTTIDVPAITTTIDGCLIVTVVFTDRQTTPHGALTGATHLVEVDVFSGGTVSIYTQTQATAGTVAADSISMQVGNPSPDTEEWWCSRFAIAPTSSGSSGSLSATLDDATLSAAGDVADRGTLDVTLGDATLSGAGSVSIGGALSTTLADATLSAAATVADRGALDITLDDATLSGVGSVVTEAAVSGSLSGTLADVTLDASGVTVLLVMYLVYGVVKGAAANGTIPGLQADGYVLGMLSSGSVHSKG